MAGCAAHTPTARVVAAPPPVVDESLGPGDLFDVRVFGETELSGAYRVGSDGSIDYPLVGRVMVGGKLPDEVAELLTDKLRVYLRSPCVSIFVREVNSKHVIVYGQVAKPGAFTYGDDGRASNQLLQPGDEVFVPQRLF